MMFPPTAFETVAYTNFATPALFLFGTAGGIRTHMMFPPTGSKPVAYTKISPQPHCLVGQVGFEPTTPEARGLQSRGDASFPI